MHRIFIFISLLTLSFSSLAEDIYTPEQQLQRLHPQELHRTEIKNAHSNIFVETITEKSHQANIYGIQAGILDEDAFNSVDIYLGLGIVSVDLLQKNYSFKALRGFLGVSTHWVVAPYMEVGFDMLEEIFNVCSNSYEDNCSTDPSFSLGLRWHINQNVMLNVYHKWYQFDGVVLDRTDIGISGISLGARF